MVRVLNAWRGETRRRLNSRGLRAADMKLEAISKEIIGPSLPSVILYRDDKPLDRPRVHSCSAKKYFKYNNRAQCRERWSQFRREKRSESAAKK